MADLRKARSHSKYCICGHKVDIHRKVNSGAITLSDSGRCRACSCMSFEWNELEPGVYDKEAFCKYIQKKDVPGYIGKVND